MKNIWCKFQRQVQISFTCCSSCWPSNCGEKGNIYQLTLVLLSFVFAKKKYLPAHPCIFCWFFVFSKKQIFTSLFLIQEKIFTSWTKNILQLSKKYLPEWANFLRKLSKQHFSVVHFYFPYFPIFDNNYFNLANYKAFCQSLQF